MRFAGPLARTKQHTDGVPRAAMAFLAHRELRPLQGF
jgi:hypothetical protein